jgi:hypothetical protein
MRGGLCVCQRVEKEFLNVNQNVLLIEERFRDKKEKEKEFVENISSGAELTKINWKQKRRLI